MAYQSDYVNWDNCPDDDDQPTLECFDCVGEDDWPIQIEGPIAGFYKVRDSIEGYTPYGEPVWSWIDEPYWECPKCKRQYGPEDWR